MSQPLRFERFEMRPDERRLLCDGEPVRLGARAFDVLLALVERAGQLVTKSELLDIAWHGLVVEEANVQVQMSALRKVLGPQAVATIPGLGYRFAMAVDGEQRDGDVEAASPRLRPAAGSNLDAALDELIGRDAELAALLAAMAGNRLVTLTGAGGIGKTRLAQAAARASVERCPRGVWWVDLAALSDAQPLVAALAKAGGLSLGTGDTLAALVRALRAETQRRLFVLDNCEHLVEPVARLVRELLDGTTSVDLLATSREPLKLRAEHVHALAPLDLPAPGATAAQARQHGAPQLFEARAAAVDRRFVLDAGNVAAVVELCRRLDGLPLAIEMAAARAPLLGISALHQQLGERLDVLQTARRDAPTRHRSLRLTLDWSQALLGRDEAMVLRRLSVFAAGFGLPAAQDTAAGDDLDRWAVVDALAGLVDKSLVKLERIDPPRYRLPEMTRVHAREQLARAGEAAATWRRHLEAMARIAEVFEGPTGDQRIDDPRVSHRLDYEDMVQAFEHACEWREADLAAVLVSALRRLDQSQGLYANSGRRVARAHALMASAGPRGRARIATFIASCGWVDPPGGTRRVDCAREAVELLRDLADTRELHDALCLFATEAARAGEHAAASGALDEARGLETPAWPARGIAYRLVHTGWVARFRGDAQGYWRACREAVELFENDGALDYARTAQVEVALALLMAGRVAESVACGEALAAELDSEGERLGIVLVNLAVALLRDGQRGRARAVVARALALGDAHETIHDDALALAAIVAAESGEPEPAWRLLAFLDANDGTAALLSDAALGSPLQDTLAALRAQLPAARQDTLRAEGARLDNTRALQLAQRLVAG